VGHVVLRMRRYETAAFFLHGAYGYYAKETLGNYRYREACSATALHAFSSIAQDSFGMLHFAKARV